ncbi:MAG: transglutaminase domain-containing protein [Phycisphaeraceae bacterium]|nr:transglutaminase domain-containing protein [Phycisphaeraceae bacterium]
MRSLDMTSVRLIVVAISAAVGWSTAARAQDPATPPPRDRPPPSEPAPIPPPGRPPEQLLTRSNPRQWTVTWDVVINAPGARSSDGSGGNPVTFVGQNTAFLLPFIPISTFNEGNKDSIRIAVSRDGRPDPDPPNQMTMERCPRTGVGTIVVPLGSVRGQLLRCSYTQTVTVWRSDLDDASAVRVAWPTEWPEEARGWLAPSRGIESDDPRFSAFVERTSQGRLRHTPVFVAAKELIRATISAFRGLEGPGVEIGNRNQVLGLRMVGAAQAMEDGTGTASDLVAACVAVLRAAGIPARPVIGVDQANTGVQRPVRTTYTVWAEFFLPGSGWVPFDPAMMRGTMAMHATPERAWTGLGRLRDLNMRVPLAYAFHPDRQDAILLGFPGGWSFSGRDVGAARYPWTFVTFTMITTPVGPGAN